MGEILRILDGDTKTKTSSFFAQGARASKSVALIPDVPATGFLIAEDLLMTNHHVFTKARDAEGYVARFNYEICLDGDDLPTQDYRLEPDTYFYTCKGLDYSIVGVAGRPGTQWGHIDLHGDRTIAVGDDVFIIQHPDGKPKEVAASGNVVTEVDVDKAVVRYTADTEIGSSGSPVFDRTWRLIGLHHFGDEERGFNEGILVSAIVRDWPGR